MSVLNVVTDFGIVNSVKLKLFLNAKYPMVVNELGNITDFKLFVLNALLAIVVKVFGNSTVSS